MATQVYNYPMSHPSTATGAQLANALHTLGVNFIMGGQDEEDAFAERPVHLIAALAESNEARLRLSLIPLFLMHPDFSRHVRTAAEELHGPARITLHCYYSAAVFLQRKYRMRLEGVVGQQPTLPDYFSNGLGLAIVDDTEENLHQLAACQQQLSGLQINWLGTYEHALKRWISHRGRVK